MRKVVINISHVNHFYISDIVLEKLPVNLKKYGNAGSSTIEYRSDPDLIKAIEDIGTVKASDYHTRLAVVEVPDFIGLTIHKTSDGDEYEEIHEICKHRVFLPNGDIEWRY